MSKLTVYSYQVLTEMLVLRFLSGDPDSKAEHRRASKLIKEMNSGSLIYENNGALLRLQKSTVLVCFIKNLIRVKTKRV